MKWPEVLGKLEQKKCFIFSSEEFGAIIGGSSLAAKRLLQRYAKKGLVSRIKKGEYLVTAQKPPDIFIANKLYQPSYVSLEYALAYYHLIPETVYTVTSITAKTTREFEVMGRLFSYAKIKTRAYTGYVPKKIDNYTVLLALPEKALADYLYFVLLRKMEPNERLDVSMIDLKLFSEFINLFQNKKLIKLAEKIKCSQKKS